MRRWRSSCGAAAENCREEGHWYDLHLHAANLGPCARSSRDNLVAYIATLLAPQRSPVSGLLPHAPTYYDSLLLSVNPMFNEQMTFRVLDHTNYRLQDETLVVEAFSPGVLSAWVALSETDGMKSGRAIEEQE